MNAREEQIAEMAKVIIKAGERYYKMPVDIECADSEASELYEAGYRKQSDTVREFVYKVLQIGSKRPLCLFNEYREGYIDCIENIKKIAKEYGVDVEE